MAAVFFVTAIAAFVTRGLEAARTLDARGADAPAGASGVDAVVGASFSTGSA